MHFRNPALTIRVSETARLGGELNAWWDETQGLEGTGSGPEVSTDEKPQPGGAGRRLFMSRDSPAEVQCHSAALKYWRPTYLEPRRPGEACSLGAGLGPKHQGNCT